MAQELTAEEANDRLIQKRKELGISPSTPSTLSQTISEVMGGPMLVVPGECFVHKKKHPCPDCAELERLDQEREAEAERKRQEIYAAEREAMIRERQDHPEKILEQIGVGKRHIGCSFEGYQGGEKIKTICKSFFDKSFDLILSGGAGSGKTHLAVAMLRELVRSCRILDGPDSYCKQDRKGCFISVPELLAKIRATYSDPNGDEEGLIDTYASAKYLVLDDLGAEKSTEWSISTLYLIIDRRYRDMLPTIVTTNLSLDEIGQHLSRRIASRLASGKVITIKAPDYRAKRIA